MSRGQELNEQMVNRFRVPTLRRTWSFKHLQEEQALFTANYLLDPLTNWDPTPISPSVNIAILT